jgi:NAD(P)H-nitrite reductase large subunit
MDYVIVGAGPAGVIAAETLREVDGKAAITLIGDEYPAPYSRMAIPYFLSGGIPEEGMTLRKEADHFKRLAIAYRNEHVTRVDPKAHSVAFAKGAPLRYDRLLVASGSRPSLPPIEGLGQAGVHPCWTVQDAREIQKRIRKGARVVLIGGGFIGCIIMNALHAREVQLTVVEMENRLLPRMMNEPGGALLKAWCERQGVQVLTSARVRSIAQAGKAGFELALDGGAKPLGADLVVIATGVVPRMEFLEGSGIQADQGLLVDEHLQTSLPDVYAAGDVAQGRDFSTEGTAVHPIQPTAADHGRVAALNMAGRVTPYQGSLVMNVLDTLGLVSHSMGLWRGAKGGQHAESLDADGFRYLRLDFDGERLVGAIQIGECDAVGVLRGLIQTRTVLGPWKQSLLADPTRYQQAFVGRHRMPQGNLAAAALG